MLHIWSDKGLSQVSQAMQSDGVAHTRRYDPLSWRRSSDSRSSVELQSNRSCNQRLNEIAE